MNIDIKTASVTELKALGFDVQNQIFSYQQGLNVILKELKDREEAEKNKPVELKEAE
jgi:hypothetical protein